MFWDQLISKKLFQANSEIFTSISISHLLRVQKIAPQSLARSRKEHFYRTLPLRYLMHRK